MDRSILSCCRSDTCSERGCHLQSIHYNITHVRALSVTFTGRLRLVHSSHTHCSSYIDKTVYIYIRIYTIKLIVLTHFTNTSFTYITSITVLTSITSITYITSKIMLTALLALPALLRLPALPNYTSITCITYITSITWITSIIVFTSIVRTRPLNSDPNLD